MRVKFNYTKVLINTLFFLIAMLSAVLGKRLGITHEEAGLIFKIGVGFGILSLAFLAFGIIYPIIERNKKNNPTKIRRRLTDCFNFAEENPTAFVRKLKTKNFFFALYYALVSVVGLGFFIAVSFCFLIKPITWLLILLIFTAVAPLRRAIEYLIKKENPVLTSDGIKEDEFPAVYEFFKDVVSKTLGNYSVKIGFGNTQPVSAVILAKTVYISINSYFFFIFSSEEQRALTVRELRAIKDKKCKKISRLLRCRSLYMTEMSIATVFNGYFSFIISDTVTNFDFSKNALKRMLERRKDCLICGDLLAEHYLRAYKKQSVLDLYFTDARSFITLKMCQDDLYLKEFVSSVYNLFLEKLSIYQSEWEKSVEKKLKAVVCDKLTYSEKCKLFDMTVKCGEFKNNCTEEQKTLYDKYNAEYYQSTKMAHEPKKRAIEDFYRDIEHYEQNPESYDERLKLINLAHAYYMTANIDEAEKIYLKILDGGDNTPETFFDYGCFLLLAKKDVKGIEYIYSSMENENLVEEGFDVLGRHFINEGDEEGYKEFCEYKAKKLDEIVNGFKSRMLNRNAKFESSSMPKEVIDEIIEKLSKDDNLVEIYCADSKTKAGSKITVFAIKVRNKTQEALVESYERVFSILDNDYGKYDTFLISLDVEKDRKLVDKIKDSNKFLKFLK